MKRFFISAIIMLIISAGCKGGSSLSMLQQGDAAFARREYTKAILLWKKALETDNNNPQIMAKLSDSYLKLGRIERARVFLQKACKASPDNVDLNIKLAGIHLLTGEIAQADKICKTLAVKKITSPALDIMQADILLLNGLPDKAESLYRKAVIASRDSLRALMKLGICLKYRNKNKEAREIIQIVKKSPVTSPEICLLMADYYLMDNLYKQAEIFINKAIELEPKDISLKYYLVQFYISSGKLTKAETCLKKILKHSKDLYLTMALADIYIMNNKLDKAEMIISELKKNLKDPVPEFEMIQGKFWLYSGKPEFAVSHFTVALELHPGLVNTRYLLGLTLLINAKTKLAENALTQTLEIFPGHPRALLLMAELLYKKKDYALSLDYLDSLIKKYPENFKAHLIMGLDLIGQKKFTRAENQFRKSLALGLPLKTYLYYSAVAHELSGKTKAAIKGYGKVLKLAPDSIDAAFRYCSLLVKTGRPETASEFIAEQLSRKQNFPLLYYLAAGIAQKTGRAASAAKLLEKAVSLEHAPGYIYMKLAEIYRSIHKYEKAARILKQCTRTKPYFQDAWLALAKYNADSGDPESAIDTMQQGYENFKDSPVFQSNLAWLLLENGQQTDRALSLAQAAYEKLGNNPAVADTLGWAYFHQKIYSQAAWVLSEAEKQAPENGFILYHLGMTFYKKGQMDKAVTYLTKAKKTESAQYFAEQADRVLKKISNTPEDTLETLAVPDHDKMFSSPDIDNAEEDMLSPQWKHQSP